MTIKGWSQSDLARASGLNRQVISSYINLRRTNPEPDALVAIAHALNIPPEEVFRIAGILPAEKPDDEIIYKIKHLYHTLKDDDSRQRALDYMQYLSEQEDRARRASKPKK